MKNRLKIVRRIGMPETNSSSSHAVSISMGTTNLVCPGDADWDIDIGEDGILRIPGGRDFGWEYFKTNSILVKLQYLCGIYCYDIRSDHGKKSIVRLKKILKQIFGVVDVEFLWITDFSERLKTARDPEEVYYSYPEIDHNSHDIFEEIIENVGVIRAFLLSRDSWLYGGNDNSEAPKGFYTESVIKTESADAIISIELGGEYGRIDWVVNNMFDQVGEDSIKRALTYHDEFSILSNLCYDITSRDWVSEELDIKGLTRNEILTYFDYSLYMVDNVFYVLFTSHDFSSEWIRIKKETVGERGMIGDNAELITEKTVKLKEEGKDYIKFPIKIKLLKYGDYEI